jgi:hypothetical protein
MPNIDVRGYVLGERGMASMCITGLQLLGEGVSKNVRRNRAEYA